MLRIKQRPYHRELIACLALMLGIAGGAAYALSNNQPLAGGHNVTENGTVAGTSTSSQAQTTTSNTSQSSSPQAQPAADNISQTGSSTSGGSAPSSTSIGGSIAPVIGGRGGGGATSSTSTTTPCACETIQTVTSGEPTEPTPSTLTAPLTDATSPVVNVVAP